MKCQLHLRTLELVRERPHYKTFHSIEEATGIPAGWLSMFARGKIDEPSVERIVRLYEYLSGNRLDIK